MQVHAHNCTDCGVTFDCDGDDYEGEPGICPETACVRCREREHEQFERYLIRKGVEQGSEFD
jgi:hypothetical protein